MKSRAVLLLCLILLLVSLSPQIPSSSASAYPDIGLGFGPSNVQPISEGIPIYTQGDNMWVESYYNETVILQLLNPNGTTLATAATAEPGELFELYSFKADDVSGTWILTFATVNGTENIPVVVSTPSSSFAPVYRGARLAGDLLNQTFALPPTDAYNIQVCSAGESMGSYVSFGSGIANGSIGVSLNGTSTEFKVLGLPSQFSIWLELYSEYSYTTSGGGIISQNLLVASTPVVSFSPSQSTTMASQLDLQMPLHQGRFDMRVFERTVSGLSLYDSQLLRTRDGDWISLDGCTSEANVNSPGFALTTNLDSSNSSWPRYLITTYDINGEEAYSQSNVPGAEAAIRLRTYPDGGPLTGVIITASAPGLQPSNWDVYASGVYVLTSGLAGKITITLSYGGVTTQNLSVSINGSYVSKSLSIPAGTLDATATLQGMALTNATISLAAPGSQPRVLAPSSSGVVSILLPPNNYTLAASYEGTSRTEVILVTAGHISSASLDLTPTSFPSLLYALAAVAVAGVMVNVYVWRQYFRRRKVYA